MLQQYLYLSYSEYFTANTVKPEIFQLNPHGHFGAAERYDLGIQKERPEFCF